MIVCAHQFFDLFQWTQGKKASLVIGSWIVIWHVLISNIFFQMYFKVKSHNLKDNENAKDE
jgi:hypothetical protein